MNLELKSWEYYLELISEKLKNWDYFLNLIYQNKLIVAASVLLLLLLYWLAKRHYIKTIRYFRSGDIIQIWKLTGKTRSGILSRFDKNNIYFIPNNGYHIVQRKWYWFFFMENVSLEERER
ncbi:hypothetical protein AAE02nite_10760 [Adhaeribacter aerolatus]|uniref:Uncharacterized protein n=1 Tax=Adhaeribacter aerolatus TaxID=670289 RepID=A0A512AUM1_9BACT|nr:hypothetical protein [Adhaeribacter aerolatus]GEO03412.1 hypothetical protein AAE02nite_10760 [Adhaeribacter aerolatus]